MSFITNALLYAHNFKTRFNARCYGVYQLDLSSSIIMEFYPNKDLGRILERLKLKPEEFLDIIKSKTNISEQPIHMYEWLGIPGENLGKYLIIQIIYGLDNLNQNNYVNLGISLENIARMNREYLKASLK